MSADSVGQELINQIIFLPSRNLNVLKVYIRVCWTEVYREIV